MQVRLIQLEVLLEELGIGPEKFVQRYPGAFMVAVGLLEGEADPGDRLIIEPSKPPREATRQRLDFTTVFRFGQQMAHATGTPHPLAGAAFHLQLSGDKTHVVVGRSADCDITVPDRSVSERHCYIEVAERGVVVLDLSSTNGTSINRVPLDPNSSSVLADEDILSVGRYSFQLLSSGSLYNGLLEVRPQPDG